jgi:NAD(P)-dependent dehydrogenase (short-subunit alcohol dehydrogenase family)
MASVHTAVLDVMDKAAIQAQIAAMDRIDGLFNCAGFVHSGTALTATDADWDLAFNLNVRSQFWAIQAALPKMIAQGGGSIINMASVASSLKGLPNRFVYGASKAAVIGLTKAVAADHVHLSNLEEEELARLSQSSPTTAVRATRAATAGGGGRGRSLSRGGGSRSHGPCRHGGAAISLGHQAEGRGCTVG